MSVVPAVAHWAISWRLISRAPASAAASAAVWALERRTAALPTWNIRTPTASRASITTSRPGRICPRSPPRIEDSNGKCGPAAAHGPGVPSRSRDRGSTLIWDSLGPPFAAYLGRHEPTAAARHPPAHPLGPGASRRVRARGGVRGGRPRGGGPEGRGPHARQARGAGQGDLGRHGQDDGAAAAVGAEDRAPRPRAPDRPGRARRPPRGLRAPGGHDRVAARAGDGRARD